MRNHLEPLESSIPELPYIAEGELDGHPFDLQAWDCDRIMINAAPCTLRLSTAAARELARHLELALDVLDIRNAKEVQP